MVLQFWQFWDSVSTLQISWQAHSLALLSSPVTYQKHKTGRSRILLISCSNFCNANLDADFWILAKDCNVFLPHFCSQCVQFVSTVVAWGSQYSANSGTVFSGHYVLGTLFSHPGYPGIVLYWQSKRSLHNLFYPFKILHLCVVCLFVCVGNIDVKIMSQGKRTWSSMAAEQKLPFHLYFMSWNCCYSYN